MLAAAAAMLAFAMLTVVQCCCWLVFVSAKAHPLRGPSPTLFLLAFALTL